MAMGTGKICCVKCGKDKATLRCGGCLQEFCFNHLEDHRQELDKQLDEIEVNRDLFRQTLTQQLKNPKTDTLIKKINEWEYNSIKKIQQTAEETRQDLLKNINVQSHQIETDLNKLTDQLRESRQEHDFNEISLRQFQEKLKLLREKLAQSSKISVQEDSTAFIGKIYIDFSRNENRSRLPGLYQMLFKKYPRPPFNSEMDINHSQQTSATNQITKSTTNNMSVFSETISDPLPSVFEESSSFNQEQEEANPPDPNSTLFSLTTFEQLNLKPELLKGIFTMGFRSPSKIQAIALPSLLSNPPRNIIAQSQSGTGKTAAFSLAILSRVDASLQYPQALILAPTFELVLQIGAVIEEMARFLPYIQIAYAVRETISNKTNFVRGQLLSQPIVVGIPGTVEDWCRRKRVIDLSKLRMCCIDEADFMIASGDFQQTCVNLVNSVNHSNCQMMLFSATYSDEVMAVARQIIQNPTVLRLKLEKKVLSNINQYYIPCYDPQQKYKAIQEIYLNLTVGQAMIFCRTKATVRELAIRMSNEGHSVRELTSALDIEQRASVIKLFREGTFRVLISTNVTTRGLDFDNVSLVINYDLPVTTSFQPDYETYVHLIGRCGRFGKIGNSFNLIGSEKDFNIMKKIEEYFSHPINEITIEGISQLKQD